MKKVIVLLASVSLLAGCGKEDLVITPDCNCGTIVSDNVDDYSVVIASDCTGNEKSFELSQQDWINAHVGDDLCITNTNGWRVKEDKYTKGEAINLKNNE